ncbi:MAG: hypothetical protein IT530_17990 [Burkholderiales bacterium]|nr:hypothetical protein [Burkholderiales bacterium]
MPTGSAAAARERLTAAAYRTGRAQYEMRCDGCAHCKPLERGIDADSLGILYSIAQDVQWQREPGLFA